MNNEIKYWVALSKIAGVGAARFKKLYSFFDSMQAAWQAPYDELKLSGLEESVINNIIENRRAIEPDAEMDKLRKEGIEAITILDKGYPALLKEIYQAPAVLYYKGALENEGDEYAIAIVGTRKYSQYGERVTERLTGELVNQGVVTVSGLALGIDSKVHTITVKYGGRTISVLGAGLDRQNIYPAANRYLADKILANNGLLLSEYPLGSLPLKGHFPQRNRIIAGLAVATLVIEAPENSGALLTARYAIENNRDVLAVPGDIYTANATGPNNLIKMGAKLVTSAADVLEALNMQQVREFVETKKISPDSEEEKIVLDILSNGEARHIDELIKQTAMRTDSVNSLLIMMEMKGKVKNLGNMMYVMAR